MAAGNTYTPLATTTLGSAAASVTFSSISGAYTDLVFVVNPMGASLSQYQRLYVNGDTGSNYSRTGLAGTGSSAYSYTDANQTIWGFAGQSTLSTDPANVSIVQLLNYSNTTTYKTFLARVGNANSGTEATVGLWRSTAAINSVVFNLNTGNYAVGSTFSLYGILAA
jgi:hypothetical protein